MAHSIIYKIFNIFFLEYDGSPRRFGTSSNEDLDGQFQYSKNSLHQTKISYSSYSPSSHPRPGFPQRVVPISQYSRIDSPVESQKLYQYGDQKVISQLIPTTLINYNVSPEPPLSKPLTIYEETQDALFEEKPTACEKPEIIQEPAQSESLENSNSFQVTSPTEEYMPTATFDYLYEFSETRKVLEEFFKCPDNDKIKELEKFSDFNESDDSLVRVSNSLLISDTNCRWFRIFNMTTVDKSRRKWRKSITSKCLRPL